MFKLLLVLCAASVQASEQSCPNITKVLGRPIASELLGSWELSHTRAGPSSASCVKLEITYGDSLFRYAYSGTRNGTQQVIESGLLTDNVPVGEILFLKSVVGTTEKLAQSRFVADYHPDEYLIVYCCDPTFHADILVRPEKSDRASVKAISFLIELGLAKHVKPVDC